MPNEMPVVMLMYMFVEVRYLNFFLLNVKVEGKVLKEKSCVQN